MTITHRNAPRSAADPLPELDELFPLRDVPPIVSPCVGRRLNIATVHRWVQKGVAGVRLRTVSVGAMRCTCRRWIAEWSEAVAAAREPAAPAPARRPARRRIAQ